jgi:lipopolysaccharide/colanic/teichoic acid biosynthesis glycosyltransferase
MMGMPLFTLIAVALAVILPAEAWFRFRRVGVC